MNLAKIDSHISSKEDGEERLQFLVKSYRSRNRLRSLTVKEEPNHVIDKMDSQSNQEQNDKLTVTSPADEYDSDDQNDVSQEETDERKGNDVENGRP